MSARLSVIPLAAAIVIAVVCRPMNAAATCRPRLRAEPGSSHATGSQRIARSCPPAGARFDVPLPAIEPVAIVGANQPFISGTSFDLASVGYEQAEYLISGNATSFLNTNSLRADGLWTAAPAGVAPYRTRILVYRPIDPAAFNGTVIVEWLNVSGGLDAAPDWITGHTEMIRDGFVWVGVSAQFVGVEGGQEIFPGVSGGLKRINHLRYGTLSHPGDSFSYDMFSQAGQVVRRASAEVLSGLTPERVIAAGESQSASRMVTYVNAIHPLVRLYDGFLVHSRGGGGSPLSQAPQATVNVPVPTRIRSDLDVPVLTFETETDLVVLGYFPSRQTDSARFRLWEVAGTAHADTYTLSVGFTDTGNSPDAAALVINASPIPGLIDCATPINSGPQHWVLNAAIAALDRWVRDGVAPAVAERLQVDPGSPPVIERDPHGNALGGIRTSWVDAPLAALSGTGQVGSAFCSIFGTTVPFDAATLAQLYPTHQAYVSAVDQVTDRAVEAGFLLAPDGELIEAQAASTDVGR